MLTVLKKSQHPEGLYRMSRAEFKNQILKQNEE